MAAHPGVLAFGTGARLPACQRQTNVASRARRVRAHVHVHVRAPGPQSATSFESDTFRETRPANLDRPRGKTDRSLSIHSILFVACTLSRVFGTTIAVSMGNAFRLAFAKIKGLVFRIYAIRFPRFHEERAALTGVGAARIGPGELNKHGKRFTVADRIRRSSTSYRRRETRGRPFPCQSCVSSSRRAADS